jgi:hypothetical protein
MGGKPPEVFIFCMKSRPRAIACRLPANISDRLTIAFLKR